MYFNEGLLQNSYFDAAEFISDTTRCIHFIIKKLQQQNEHRTAVHDQPTKIYKQGVLRDNFDRLSSIPLGSSVAWRNVCGNLLS